MSMGLYFRMGHVSRRWGFFQFLSLAIVLAWGITLMWLGPCRVTRALGYLAFAAFVGFVVFSFLSKRENDRDDKPPF